MSDYDAFGRKKDDSGLGDLGWGTSDDPGAASSPQPTVSTADSGFQSPGEFTSVPTSPPPVRRGRNPVAIIVQLAILGAIVYGIYAAVDAGNDAVDDVRETFEQIGGGPGGGGGGADRGDDTVPEQVAPRKLFTAGGLRDALKVLEREVPGRITNLSIRRETINIQVVRGGERYITNFDADAEVPDVITTTTAGAVSGTLSYEEVNPTAPARLMKAANARLGQSEADVDYFVISKFGDAIQWNIYYEGGSPIATGDSRGRYVRRIS
jgi:hypothetical protein